MVEELNSTVISVFWSTPVFENGIISHYTLYYAEDVAGNFPNEESVVIEVQQGTENYTFTLTNLTEFTGHRLQVSATTGAGEGDRTQEVLVQTDPDGASPPTEVNATAFNSTTIILTWNYPSNPRGLIRGYIIRHNATMNEINITLSLLDDNSTQTYQFVDLFPFTYYSFMAAAYSFSDEMDAFQIHLGSFSGQVVERTDEDREYETNIVSSYMQFAA